MGISKERYIILSKNKVELYKRLEMEMGLKDIKVLKNEDFKKLFQKKESKIKVKLIRSFFVPVILIILLGTISYYNASKTIQKNYKVSSRSTLDAMGMYTELMITDLSSKITEIANNKNLISYYTKFDKLSTSESRKLYNDTKTTIVNMKASSDKIFSYHIFSEKGSGISSAGTLPGTTYDEYIESPEGLE